VQRKSRHIFCSKTFFESRAVYEIMWKNIVERGRPLTIWRTRIARWIPKATNTHSDCVVLTAFPLQQRTHLYVTVHVDCVPYIRMLVPDDGLMNKTKHISCFSQ